MYLTTTACAELPEEGDWAQSLDGILVRALQLVQLYTCTCALPAYMWAIREQAQVSCLQLARCHVLTPSKEACHCNHSNVVLLQGTNTGLDAAVAHHAEGIPRQLKWMEHSESHRKLLPLLYSPSCWVFHWTHHGPNRPVDCLKPVSESPSFVYTRLWMLCITLSIWYDTHTQF